MCLYQYNAVNISLDQDNHLIHLLIVQTGRRVRAGQRSASCFPANFQYICDIYLAEESEHSFLLTDVDQYVQTSIHIVRWLPSINQVVS